MDYRPDRMKELDKGIITKAYDRLTPIEQAQVDIVCFEVQTMLKKEGVRGLGPYFSKEIIAAIGTEMARIEEDVREKASRATSQG